MYHATKPTQDSFDKLYDQYGDSFTEDATIESLRILFTSMSSPEFSKSDRNDPKTFRSIWTQIAEFENEYYPDESSEFGLFRLCDIYLAPTYSGRLLELKIRWKGGIVSSEVKASTTHCIVDKK